MERKLVVLVSYLLTLVIVACTNKISDQVILPVKYGYESRKQAMAHWPGLFQKVDTSLVIIDIVDDERTVINRFLYEGKSDTFWTKVVEKLKKDTTISVGADTLGSKVKVSPILPDSTKFTFYFMSNFDKKRVVLKNNSNEIFRGLVQTYHTKVTLSKESLGELILIFGDNEAIIKPQKKYNFIEIIPTADTLICNQYYFVPI